MGVDMVREVRYLFEQSVQLFLDLVDWSKIVLSHLKIVVFSHTDDRKYQHRNRIQNFIAVDLFGVIVNLLLAFGEEDLS